MNPIVTTSVGKIQGTLNEAGDVHIFRGVPYGEPPVGEGRFRRPRPKQPWTGVLPCVKFPPRCVQLSFSQGFYAKEFYDVPMPDMSEDCLYLNIWTPAETSPSSRFPVMVWIHGGAFMGGFSSEKEFDGEGLARKGVILVTINYRLNVFGYFTHQKLEEETEEGVSGNYGLLDQLCALRWVKDHISDFGGDPEKITLAGQSAGCMSVQTLISSPLAEGLVRGAILQSGGGIGGLRQMPSKEELWETSQEFMEQMQVKTIQALRALPAEQLVLGLTPKKGKPPAWGPHVDGWAVPDTEDRLAEAGKIQNVTYLIGCAGDDLGEGILLESGRRWCENLLRLDRVPGYLYYFDRKLPGDQAGAFHSCELWYEFETLDRCWRPWKARDWELSKFFSSYIANFVKTGDPNGPELPQWEPYLGSNSSPMIFR